VDNTNAEIQFKKGHFSRHNKFGLLISRDSVATYLRFGEQCYTCFVANLITFLVVKEFWKYVKFWPSYS